jgi:hypothetical protein
MGIRLGMHGVLYRNTGTYAVPVWEALTNVRDLTLNLEKGEADVTTRGNNSWRATAPTLKDGTIEFEMVWDTDDAGFTAIQQAYFTDGTLEMAIMDGDITESGTQGLRATMGVTNFSRNEELEEAMRASVSMKPAYAANAPAWMEVA